jgi:hypothetical protein
LAIDWFREFEEVGRALRLGREAQGCAALVQCLDKLQQQLADLPLELTNQILVHLGVALAAQQRKDYLQVADLLEYEIAPLLQMAASQIITPPFSDKD